MKTTGKLLLPVILLAAQNAQAVYSVANGNDSDLPVVIAKSGGNSQDLFINTAAIWSDGNPPHNDADYVAMSNVSQYVRGSCTTEFDGHSFQVGTADYTIKNSKAAGHLYLYNRSDTTPPGILRFNNEGLYLVNGSIGIRYYHDTFIDGKVTVFSDAAHPFLIYSRQTSTPSGSSAHAAGYVNFWGPVSGASTAALLVRGDRDNVKGIGLKAGNDWSKYYGTVTVTGMPDTVGTFFPLGSIRPAELWITNTVMAGTAIIHDGCLLRSLVPGEPFTISNLVLKAGSNFTLSGDVTVGTLTMEGGAKINVIPSADGTVLPTITVLDSVSVSGGAAEFTINGYSFDAGAAATVLTLPAGAAVTPADFSFTGTSLGTVSDLTFAIQTVVEDGDDACRVKARFTRDLVLAADAALALSSDMTVTSLEAAGGATVTFAAASDGMSFPSLTVLDAISVTDGKLNIVLSGYADTNGANSAVLKLPAGTTLTADDLSVTGVSAAGLPLAPDEVTVAVDAVTGAVTVTPVFSPIVTQLSGDDTARTSEKSSSLTNATHWSDGLEPHAGAHYYTAGRYLRFYDSLPCKMGNEPTLDQVFPGLSLTLGAGGGLTIVCRTVEIPRLAVFGSGSAGIYACAYANAVLYAPTEIPAGSAIVANIGYGRLFTLDGEIAGGGDLTLRGLGGGSSSTPSGYGLLASLNTNFSGRVTLTIPVGGSGDRLTPQFSGTSNKKYFTMYVNDGRNLGGPMEPADPKGIVIHNMSRLAVASDATDVTFDEPTRGIFIDWVGRFYPTNGQSITVKSPLAVHGTMYKEGNGVLALGSAVKFGADGTLDRWEAGEDATNHAFKVLGGDVRILHADALNGLDVTVSNSASAFLLPANATDADLRTYGIRNVKTDAPFAVAVDGAQLNVRLEAPETPLKAQDVFGIITVPLAQTNEVAQMLTVQKPAEGFEGFGLSLALEANDDGETATFKAVVRTRGTAFIFR